MNEKTRQVIIGNSAAALSAVKSIRKKDHNCSVTLISAENCYAYSPVLTTYYISNKITKERFFINDQRFYDDYNIQVVLGNRVEGINISGQEIYLQDNTKIPYDNLLVATGATPKHLNGIELDAEKYVFTLRTIADADKIKEKGKVCQDIVIVGAGLVSLQVANALYRIKDDIKITVLVSSNQIMSQNLDAETAQIVQEKIQLNSGIKFIFGKNIIRVGKIENSAVIVLDSGEELFADMVVVGKGVDPNVDFLKDSGINLNKGIIVDLHLRTNVKNIFAAGDVAEGYNFLSGKQQNVPNWANALEQGRAAGKNMVGQDELFKGVMQENITTLFGQVIASIGLTNSRGGVLVKEHIDRIEGNLRKFWVKDNKIVGALLVGEIQDVGLVKNLINNTIDVSNLGEFNPKFSFNNGELLINHNYS